MLHNVTRISQNQSPPKDTETRTQWAVLLQCSPSSTSDTTTPSLSMEVHPQCKGTTSVGIKVSLLLPTDRCNNLQCSTKDLTAMVDTVHLRATECQISEWTLCSRCQEAISPWIIMECQCKEDQFQEWDKMDNTLTIQMDQIQIRLDSITLWTLTLLLTNNNQWV
jgi:hypothetical protein